MTNNTKVQAYCTAEIILALKSFMIQAPALWNWTGLKNLITVKSHPVLPKMAKTLGTLRATIQFSKPFFGVIWQIFTRPM